MRVTKLAGVCLATTLLTACWMQPGFGPARQNFNPRESSLTAANVAALTQTWSTFVELGVGGQPLVTPGAVYASGTLTINGQPTFVIAATARGTGTRLWQRNLALGGPSPNERLLSVADGKVLVVRSVPSAPSPALQLEELDGATGQTLRTAPLANPYLPDSVTLAGDIVAFREAVAGIDRPHVAVRSRATLAVLWTGPDAGSQQGVGGPIVVARGRLYDIENMAAPAPGTPVVAVLQAFAAGGCGGSTCAPVWSTTLPIPADADSTLTFTLLAAGDDGTVFVRRTYAASGAQHADLLRVDPSGAVGDTISLTRLSGLAVAGNSVYVTGSDPLTPAGASTLFAFSGTAPQWRADVAEGLVGDPVVAGGLVYVQDGPDDGNDIRVYPAGQCMFSCPALTTVDTGEETGALSGISVTFGGLYVSQIGGSGGGGIPDRLIAYRPAA
jgi:outer membrane protein assembly factor BamB